MTEKGMDKRELLAWCGYHWNGFVEEGAVQEVDSQRGFQIEVTNPGLAVQAKAGVD
jgi:hypothetical protein